MESFITHNDVYEDVDVPFEEEPHVEVRYYSKPGCAYALATDMHDEAKLVSLGFGRMDSDFPGGFAVAQKGGTWGIDAEEERNSRLAAIDARLAEIDTATIRPMRALLDGSGTEDDKARLAALEQEAEALRGERASLLYGEGTQ